MVVANGTLSLSLSLSLSLRYIVHGILRPESPAAHSDASPEASINAPAAKSFEGTMRFEPLQRPQSAWHNE